MEHAESRKCNGVAIDSQMLGFSYACPTLTQSEDVFAATAQGLVNLAMSKPLRPTNTQQTSEPGGADTSSHFSDHTPK